MHCSLPGKTSMSEMGRYCCKSRKLQGHESLAKTRSGKQSPIRTDAIALSKSPVCLTLGDEAPHILTRKSRLQPLEFLIISAKRLLQHNRRESGHRSDIVDRSKMTLTGLGRGRTRSCFVTYDIVRQTDPRLSRAPPNVAVDFNALGIIQCAAGYESEARTLL